jgi:chaperonin GroEL
MPKLMLFQAEARAALGRGVEKLTKTVQGTLGPKGGNTIIDTPLGTPIVSRDGVSIVQEIELEDLFENIGAQVAREVSMKTNEVAGDGTTTAMVLANALIQQGFAVVKQRANPIDVVDGIEQAIAHVIKQLKRAAQPIKDDNALASVARIAANDPALGRLVAQAVRKVGANGIITVEYGQGTETTLDLVEGFAFDRTYLSHHMVTNPETMDAIIDNALLLLTDQRIRSPQEIAALHAIATSEGRPMLIIAEDIVPEALSALLAANQSGGPRLVAVHPPEYGKWRQAMLEDIATITGGRVLARELGARVSDVQLSDFGSAEQVWVTPEQTVIRGGNGDPQQIRGRQAQVLRQLEQTEALVDRDKLEIRQAKLAGGIAVIRVGGVTPSEQKRRDQMIEDAISATRAAVAEGVVAGGGTAYVQAAATLNELIGSLGGGAKDGAQLVQRALTEPLRCIAENCGAPDPAAIVARVQAAPPGTGFNAWTGELVDMVEAGIIDPVKVSYTALQNAGSVAGLILTTQALVADKPEFDDPTAGPTRGGGAEQLGMDQGRVLDAL